MQPALVQDGYRRASLAPRGQPSSMYRLASIWMTRKGFDERPLRSPARFLPVTLFSWFLRLSRLTYSSRMQPRAGADHPHPPRRVRLGGHAVLRSDAAALQRHFPCRCRPTRSADRRRPARATPAQSQGLDCSSRADCHPRAWSARGGHALHRSIHNDRPAGRRVGGGRGAGRRGTDGAAADPAAKDRNRRRAGAAVAAQTLARRTG